MKTRYRYFLFGVLFSLSSLTPLFHATKATGTTAPSGPVNYAYRIVGRLPHDSQAFTQGLVYQDGYFYESTGLMAAPPLPKSTPATEGSYARLNWRKHISAKGICPLRRPDIPANLAGTPGICL